MLWPHEAYQLIIIVSSSGLCTKNFFYAYSFAMDSETGAQSMYSQTRRKENYKLQSIM